MTYGIGNPGTGFGNIARLNRLMGSQCSYVLFLDNLDIRGKLVDILV